MLPPSPTAAALSRLRHAVDATTAELVAHHRDHLCCSRSCADCCQDDLTVLAIEADAIRAAHHSLLTTGSPAPRGRCAFLDPTGSCRVYAERPYVCRTQGLPLRWFEEDEDGEIVEQRAVCARNLSGIPLARLTDPELWLLGPTELELLELDAAASEERAAGALASGAERPRVALRALFTKQDPWRP